MRPVFRSWWRVRQRKLLLCLLRLLCRLLCGAEFARLSFCRNDEFSHTILFIIFFWFSSIVSTLLVSCLRRSSIVRRTSSMSLAAELVSDCLPKLYWLTFDFLIWLDRVMAKLVVDKDFFWLVSKSFIGVDVVSTRLVSIRFDCESPVNFSDSMLVLQSFSLSMLKLSDFSSFSLVALDLVVVSLHSLLILVDDALIRFLFVEFVEPFRLIALDVFVSWLLVCSCVVSSFGFGVGLVWSLLVTIVLILWQTSNAWPIVRTTRIACD